jgi:ubiquinone/menaquinone biosynthesis C-methylase UbiE
MFEPSTYSRRWYSSIVGVLLHRIRLIKLVNISNALKGDSVLEIGSHDLFFYYMIDKKFIDYIGIDIGRENGLYFARKNKKEMGWRRVEIFHGTAEYLPYANAVFDLIFCFETLEHVSNERSAISEMTRVLKPGGRVVISIPIEFGLILLLKFLFRYAIGQREYNLSELSKAVIGREPKKIKRNEHKGYDYRKTILHLQTCGLKIVEENRYPCGWLPDSFNIGVIVVLKKDPLVPKVD